jgi:hypothetical protein
LSYLIGTLELRVKPDVRGNVIGDVEAFCVTSVREFERRLPHPLAPEAVEDLLAYLIAESWRAAAAWDANRERLGWDRNYRLSTHLLRLHRKRVVDWMRATHGLASRTSSNGHRISGAALIPIRSSRSSSIA